MEKKRTVARIIFALAFIAYIALTLLAVFVFEVGRSPELSFDLSLFGHTATVSLIDSMSALQMFCIFFPVFLFLCSLVFELTSKKKK